MFTYPPTPEVLNWLAKGRLADRQLRAIRLWVILHLLYGEGYGAGSGVERYGESYHAGQFPRPFRYADMRDRLYAPSHGRSDTGNAQSLSAACNTTCRCQQSLQSILSQAPLADSSLSTWKQQFIALTGLSLDQLETILPQRPFATVHRSIRGDLSYLAANGWLTNQGQGRFCTIPSAQRPQMAQTKTPGLNHLSVTQLWEIVRSLESIAFVKPNLEVIIQALWEQLVSPPAQAPTSHLKNKIVEPEQRIFIHLDYILSDTMQEQVDTLQEQIEQLWHQDANGGGGVIQFDYWRKDSAKTMTMTVYPVCLHYARRAKYLSAYGHEPDNKLGWHNYRLDRIASSQLTLLSWEDEHVPKALKKIYQAGTLPTASDVNTALEDAWGFNFYLPRQLLIMRFPATFAHWYVDQTERHKTFEPIAYEQLTDLVIREVNSSQEQSEILKILSKRSSNDAYYKAWVRLGDINIVMRLRDWRPKGEVISPLVLRERMYKEAKAELMQYE